MQKRIFNFNDFNKYRMDESMFDDDTIPKKDIENVFNDPLRAPKISRFRLGDQLTFCKAVARIRKNVNDDRLLGNVAEWVINSIIYSNVCIVFLEQFTIYHPEILQNEFWTKTCIKRFVEKFPDLLKNSELNRAYKF